MSDGLAFSRLMEDYGNTQSRRKDTRSPGLAKKENDPRQDESDSAEDVLMQLEERNVGAVSWDIYKKYLRYAGGLVWAPVILIALVLSQGSQGWVLLGYSMFALTPFSRHDTVPWILDGKYHTWLQPRQLHGRIRCAWYKIFFCDTC